MKLTASKIMVACLTATLLGSVLVETSEAGRGRGRSGGSSMRRSGGGSSFRRSGGSSSFRRSGGSSSMRRSGGSSMIRRGNTGKSNFMKRGGNSGGLTKNNSGNRFNKIGKSNGGITKRIDSKRGGFMKRDNKRGGFLNKNNNRKDFFNGNKNRKGGSFFKKGNNKFRHNIFNKHHNKHHHHKHHGWGFGLYRKSRGWGYNYNCRKSFGCNVYYGSRYRHYGCWTPQTYYNPYCSGTTVINYEAPITVVAEEPIEGQEIVEGQEPVAPEMSDALAAAQEAFVAGDYQTASEQITIASKEMPQDVNVHQLRSLVMFALGDYQTAAAAAHMALTGGAGWDWETLRGFYGDIEIYTAQLRGLEESVKANAGQVAPHFLLAYHYLMMGHQEAAARHLTIVIELEPRDQLSAKLLQLAVGQQQGPELAQGPVGQQPVGQPGQPQLPVGQQPVGQPQLPVQPQQPIGQPGQPQPPVGQPPVGQPQQPVQAPAQGNAPEAPPAVGGLGGLAQAGNGQPQQPQAPQQQQPAPSVPQIAGLPVGVFTAKPADGVVITMTVKPDQTFVWSVDAKGKKSEFSGQYTIADNTLTLVRSTDNEKLVGTISKTTDGGFRFKLNNTDAKDPGLAFTR